MVLYRDYPLKEFTTVKIGGKSRCFFSPKNVNELLEYLPRLVQDYQIFILGGGSNTIFGNFKGCVISTQTLRGFSIKKKTKEWIELEIFGGTPLKDLIKLSVSGNWSGLEGLFGIPRITFGGAVAMNASAYSFEIGKLVKEVRFIDLNTLEENIDSAPRFGYRSSPYRGGAIIISTRLRLYKSQSSVRETIRNLNFRRKKSQPLTLPTAGSTFKNPLGFFAGKLLEEVGLKGYCTSKGLCFSKKHANFMVNISKRATLEDVYELTNLAKERVFKTFGVVLEEEVQLVGEV